MARRLGLQTISDSAGAFPSLTLGGTNVRPLEMAGAYAAIANDGRFNPPHFVSQVKDRDGNLLFQFAPTGDQAIPVKVSRDARVAMEGVVTGGTYKGGSLPDRRPAAGKTGTNEAAGGENTDVWFVGFTPELATAVWIGNPAGATELRGGRVQGGTTAGKVWHDFMFPYLDGTPVREFEDAGRPGGDSDYITDPWRRVVAIELRSSRLEQRLVLAQLLELRRGTEPHRRSGQVCPGPPPVGTRTRSRPWHPGSRRA